MALVVSGYRAVVLASATKSHLTVSLATHRGQHILIAAGTGGIVNRFSQCVIRGESQALGHAMRYVDITGMTDAVGRRIEQFIKSGKPQIGTAQAAVLHREDAAIGWIQTTQWIVDRRGGVHTQRILCLDQRNVLRVNIFTRQEQMGPLVADVGHLHSGCVIGLPG